jgi:hypothetical protein
MKATPMIKLAAVQAVYSGPEGQLWELLMGEQIREHVGGQTGLPVVEAEVPPVCDALLPALRTRLQAEMEIARARRKTK